MAYTPELSQRDSAILRRLAWALKEPMTVTLSFIMYMAAECANKELVCGACKDMAFCSACPFQEKGEDEND